MKRVFLIIGLILFGVGLVLESAEVNVQQILLEGPVISAKAEISGMAWYKDRLILLPQYPHKFSKDSKSPWVIFAIAKKEIQSYLSQTAKPNPIRPKEMELVVPESILKEIKGFQGFEAIGFWKESVFLTIEAQLCGDEMMGWIVKGKVSPDGNRITLDETIGPVQVPPAAPIDNYTEESILVTAKEVITIYEANGKNVNPQPKAHVFDHNLRLIKKIAFPHIEYRITDATEMNESGEFWAINYLWPEDIKKLKVAEDQLAKKYGRGPSHQNYDGVERLVKMVYTGDKIALLELAPIQLQMRVFNPNASCNWEGLVRLDDRGFLIVTDKYPDKTTIFGFVPAPKQ